MPTPSFSAAGIRQRKTKEKELALAREAGIPSICGIVGRRPFADRRRRLFAIGECAEHRGVFLRLV